jgi:hypothetical protein
MEQVRQIARSKKDSTIGVWGEVERKTGLASFLMRFWNDPSKANFLSTQKMVQLSMPAGSRSGLSSPFANASGLPGLRVNVDATRDARARLWQPSPLIDTKAQSRPEWLVHGKVPPQVEQCDQLHLVGNAFGAQ